MGSIFGKDKSKSVTKNLAYDSLNSSFSPLFGEATGAASKISQLLSGDATGLEAYKRATGFDATANRGARGIMGTGAARGLLRSGSTGMALQNYGQEISNQYSNNYLAQLLGLGNMGLQAGQLVGGAGQTTTSTSTKKPGLTGLLGALPAGAAASDRRLKKHVTKVSELSSGIGVYEYHYIDGTGPFIGVMADEVAKVQPEALGPTVHGYMTVDYSKLEKVG